MRGSLAGEVYTVSDECLYFDAVKVLREGYFVEYRPPAATMPFATVQLVFIRDAPLLQVAEAMERELAAWLGRYPIAVMVSAFDPSGSVYDLETVRSWGHVLGYFDPITRSTRMVWGSVPNEQLPRRTFTPEYLEHVYSDIPHRTAIEVRRAAEQHYRQVRLGILVIVAWVVGGAVAVAVVELFSPLWLAIPLFLFSLWKAYVKAMTLLGKRERTPKQIAADEEALRMRHHHYHCERNPEGFIRLRNENFERSERDAIQAEARALAAKNADPLTG
jgi:hypothetical protein